MRPSTKALCLCLATLCAAATPTTVDVLVVKANPAGIAAAIAAASGGLRVLLLDDLLMIGGMGAAGGVGLMNQGCGDSGMTGLGRQWGLINGAHYGDPTRMELFPEMWVAERSWWQLLNASRGDITTRLGCRLVSVARGGGGACLSSAEFLCRDAAGGGETPLSVSASVFIDASYDGDVMVAAGGISYAHGREAASEYNESLAGVNYMDDGNESFDKQGLSIDATYPDGTLLRGISSQPLQPAGSADDRLMAFSFFPCVTSNTSNSIPYPRPEGYDPADFELLQRQIDGVVANGRFPNGPDLSYFSESHLYDPTSAEKLLLCCGVGPVNCDEPDANAGWATANYSERLRIEADVKYYLLGSLYYMSHELRVPNYTRYAVGRWGLCADEYAAHGNWPPQMYVRISNRLRGMSLLTQNNIATPRNKPDGVSMACWEFDQHTMSRHAVRDPKNASRLIAVNEGYMRAALTAPHARVTGSGGGDWYDVPFGVTIPQRGEASNLCIPVALSATSIAYSSARIEGMYADLGTACGVAARLAIEAGGGRGACPTHALQDTNVSAVQDILVGEFAQRVHGPPPP